MDSKLVEFYDELDGLIFRYYTSSIPPLKVGEVIWLEKLDCTSNAEGLALTDFEIVDIYHTISQTINIKFEVSNYHTMIVTVKKRPD